MESDDVDPRYALANERTFLAWIRTALGLLAGAAGILGVNLPWPAPVEHGLAGLLAAIAGLSAVLAWTRWRRVEESIRQRRPVSTPRSPAVLSIAVATVAGIVLVLAIA